MDIPIFVFIYALQSLAGFHYLIKCIVNIVTLDNIFLVLLKKIMIMQSDEVEHTFLGARFISSMRNLCRRSISS